MTESPRHPRDRVPEDVRAHLDAARVEVRRTLETFLPPDFFTHRDAARKEMLLASRSAIDAVLRRIDARATAGAAGATSAARAGGADLG